MDDDIDVPDSGGAFSFGKSKFASNIPGKFWIRDDPILQVACGDEHTAFITASGRVFTFGSNEWGQLGHGHTNSLTKPSCVKGLKHERAVVLACGRSHTLVATATGHVYGFGTNAEGQLGSSHEYTIHMAPVRIQGLEDVSVKMLSAGAEHSVALTDRGIVYVWGNGSEGQLGLDKTQYFVPTELKFDTGVMCVSAGYYHSAFVTVDGKVHTCGERESGKLGVAEADRRNSAFFHKVSGIHGHAISVSCGGNHTVVLTADGKAYSFGSGFNGQLGLGDNIAEASTPQQITYLENIKIARVSCGENHTGFLSDAGYLYTCGDGRHGKLGLLDDNDGCCNRFFPTLVKRFWDFQVQQVACGGCHMLVLATRKASFLPANISSLAREKRREKLMSLPSLQSPTSLTNNSLTNDAATSLRSQTRPRLPSISKSPVWYVPLENVADSNSHDEDDDVLSKSERRSMLDDLEEDKSIRHVDSDVESNDSETFELNQTHTLIRIDNTISIIRPVISDCPSSLEECASLKKEDGMEPNSNESIPNQNECTKANLSIPKQVGKQPSKKTTKNAKVEQKSQFYDGEDGKSSKTSSLSKSSKACVLL